MMNLKKLFVVGSVLVIAWTTANAELVNGVRQKPEPATTAWAVGTQEAPYYLYNTSAKLFFMHGNTWGTRGCVGPAAYAIKVYFSEVSEGSETYYLNDLVNNKDWKMACGEGAADAIYTDQGSGWGRPQWIIVPQTGNVFRIQTTTPLDPTDETPKFMGRDDAVGQDFYNAKDFNKEDNKRFPVSVELKDSTGHHIDWAIVNQADYEDIVAKMAVYDKAEELMSYIKSAKDLEIDMTTEQALYENEASSIEDMDAAISGIQDKIKAKQANNATLDNPADMTASLVNPGFANGKTGWNGTDPAFGEGAAEFYEKSFDFYQTLKDMPNGVYGVSVQAFHRTSWSNVSYEDWQKNSAIPAKVYAKSGADSLNTSLLNPWTLAQTGDLDELKQHGSWKNSAGEEVAAENGYIPNNMKAASYLFSLNPENYKTTAYVAVDNGELTFGLKKSDKGPGGNWTMFDNFTLSYFGTAPEAYQMCLTKGMPAKTEYTTASVSKRYIDAYDAAYTLTATDKASLSAAVKAIYSANDSIAKNMQLWADLKTKYEKANEVKLEYSIFEESAGILGDYIEDGYDENLEEVLPGGVKGLLEAEAKEGDVDVSNTVLENIMATIDKMIEAVYKEAKESVKPGDNVTRFMKNPDFEGDINDWTIEKNDKGNVQLGGNADNHCYEAWHCTNFNVYQEIKNLPVGLYKLEVNGFVRYLDGNDALTKANEAPEDPGIYLYMNNSKTNLVNLMSYPKPESFYKYDKEAGTGIEGAAYLKQDEENCFPDNMIAASAAFRDGGYSQYTICMVTEDDVVTRVGVKGTPEEKYWPIFDNFKLTFLGLSAEQVKPVLEEKIAEAKKYEGVMTTKTAKTNFDTEVNAAVALLDGEDGQAMFLALDKLQKAIDDVKAGMAPCKELAALVEEFIAFAQNTESALQSDGMTLAATIQGQLDACELEANEIDGKKLALREMELKMQLPADYTQGSADGADLTAFIRRANFSKYKEGSLVNAIDGWQNTNGYKFGNDDTQKGALAVEFYNTKFDMYQDIATVGEVVFPKGYYCLQVNAFERVNDESPAFLYAVAGKDTLDTKELMKHAAGFDEEAGETGPGDMVSSVSMFEEGRYLNQIKFKFEGDTLRIGIKHEKNNGTDWVIMDNFKLFFYGNDNTGVETVMNIGKPVKVQYFTLDGRQVSAARKGLVIRKTIMDNGAVVVRKIQK